jgi:hypothetical protein
VAKLSERLQQLSPLLVVARLGREERRHGVVEPERPVADFSYIYFRGKFRGKFSPKNVVKKWNFPRKKF